MKLPNAVNAIIEENKIVEYLLNVNHRRGGSKARFLNSLGYNSQDWPRLDNDLRQQHLTADVVEHRETGWGQRYDIVAPLTCPMGDTVMFHSIGKLILAQTSHA
jgi:hypothetical protein